jgi:hypothetical protein
MVKETKRSKGEEKGERQKMQARESDSDGSMELVNLFWFFLALKLFTDSRLTN